MVVKDEEKRKKRLREFILATEKIINEEGLEAFSIRKVAQLSQCHNSTIFLYFRDVDLLLATVAVRFLKAYSKDLAELDLKGLNPKDYFFAIWETFCKHAFISPKIFHLLFFGKYRKDISKQIELYYFAFPEEKHALPDRTSTMFYDKDIWSRNLSILTHLMDDKSCNIHSKNIDYMNNFIISLFYEMLIQDGPFSDMDKDELSSYFLNALHVLIDSKI